MCGTWYHIPMIPTRLQLAVVMLVCVVFVVPAPVQAALPIYADGVLAFTNAERYREGLPILSSNEALSRAAAAKLQDLFANQYFAHESPSGESASDLITGAGYKYLAVGENLALGSFTSNKHVVTAWMDSPGHRANILKPTYTEIGIAAGHGVYQGRSAWIVVQHFGLPKTECPAVDTKLRATIDSQEDALAIMQRLAAVRKAQLETTSRGSSLYRARLAAFTLAANSYNEYAANYRSLVEQYNEGVDDFNTCVTRVTKG